MPTAISLPILLVLLATPPLRTGRQGPPPGDDPRTIVRSAVLAIRGDSSPALGARWSARLRQDSTDRAAMLGLSTLARLTYDFEDAKRRYRRLFVGSSTGGRPDRYDPYARIGLALAMEAEGTSGEPVLALYREAIGNARASGDRNAEGLAHFRLGNTLAPLGRIPEGFLHFDSAMRVLPPSPDGDDVRAVLRCRRAQIFVAISSPGNADTLRAANAFAARVNDDEGQAVCLRATALLYWLSSKQDSTLVADNALIGLRRRMRDHSGLAVALALRADHLRSVGDFGGATRVFREALAEARLSKNHYIEASVALGFGGTALTLNDHAAAAEYVERAIAAFDAAHDSGSLMLALSFRPFVTMVAGDLDGARRQTLSVLDFWRRQEDWGHLVELHLQLATIEMRAGDYAAAERALDAADDAAKKARSPASVATVAYRRGQLALRRGDLAGAERGFARFLGSMDTTEHLMRYDGRVRVAEVYARRGDAARAERELSGAGNELDAWRATLTDPEMRTLAFQASPFEANDRNASIAVIMAALVQGGRATAAFDLAERRRARELGERLTRTQALLERDTAGGATRTPTRDSTAVGARSLTLDEVAAAIPDTTTALLEYVTGTGGEPTTLFVVTRGRTAALAAHVLPSAQSYVGGVSRLVTLLEGGDDPRQLERALGAALLDSAVAALPASVTRLVIIPDGPLHRLPWDVVRLADGRYAIERFAIGVAPSATIVATLWRTRRAAPAVTRLLAFGDPAFPVAKPSDDAGETFRSAFASAGGLPRLPNSAKEARLVAGYADESTVRLGADATADFLERSPLDRYDVLHFATHALVDDRAATRNALALTPGGSDGDGFVAPADLAALHMNAGLVVLSACRSAGGVVVDGEGVQGLTAPLLAAGARTVVATTWRISDRGTVPFIEAFYDAMARKLPVADALREAKLEALHRGAPPRDWAAFAAVGDPFTLVSLHEPRRNPRWWLWVAATIALAAVGYGVTRGRRRAPAASA